MVSSTNIQSYHITKPVILWLDSDASHAEKHTKYLLDNNRDLIDSVRVHGNIGECIDFFRSVTNANIVLVITSSFPSDKLRYLMKYAEEMIMIDSVFVFTDQLSEEQTYLNDCSKLHGIFVQIEHFSFAIRCRFDLPHVDSKSSNSISSIDESPAELDSFNVYSKLFFDLITQLSYDDTARKEGFNACRKFYTDDGKKLKDINVFEENYSRHSPMWWFIKQSILNDVMRNALVTQNWDMLIQTGMFIRDLHREIKQIYSTAKQTSKFAVYFGQRMSSSDFEQSMKSRKGHLHVFHCFLLTSLDRQVAVRSLKSDHPHLRIIFEMEIDPCQSTIPYAYLNDSSYYSEGENIVVLSSHSIFQINDITYDKDDLWKVKLILTYHINPRLKPMTDYIRDECLHATGWESLAALLHKMGRADKAMDVLKKSEEVIVETNDNTSMRMLASNQNNMGFVNDSMGEYATALENYEKALKTQEAYLPPDHPCVAIIYNNIAMTYRSLGDYRNALLYCNKALTIRSNLPSTNHKELANSYSSLGMIYESQGDYRNALSYYEKTYEIQKSSLQSDDPSFALSYNNLGAINCLLGDYSKALSYYEQTLRIQVATLLSNHSSLAATYSRIGHIYQLTGKFTYSLFYYEKALKIQQKVHPTNPLLTATIYNNIGLLYRLMERYPNAQLYYRKALRIEKKIFQSDHPSLGMTYNNLAYVHQCIGEYQTAVALYETTLKIWQTSYPSDHPLLATIYNNLGTIQDSLRNHQEALSQYQKAFEILRKSSATNPLNLAAIYNNMGEVYRSIGDYRNAMSHYRETLSIEEKHLSPDHPSLAITLSNMATALDKNKQIDEALGYAERAFDIVRRAFGPSHSETARYQKYLNELQNKRVFSG
ncbi:unnamed protein product [Adineta ricciae]|uniref:Uncharacterized protein n=1 Tax=Adineta ricciae TaxID=249248 RepID=A0A815WNK9_ADIRI|nr:unnamed protein product [Adineta ricciae]CAF1547641.1 unnamed protein product [Adineta ricciae]